MEYATGGSLFNYVQKQGMLNVGPMWGYHSDAILRLRWVLGLPFSCRRELTLQQLGPNYVSVTCSQETASRWFFQQLILGLDYCHKRGVANRDIK